MLVNYSGREINAKLVYYGPGLSGKTTNLEYIYSAIPQTHRGKMVSMKTKTERTLFFDFLPIHLGELSGFKTRFLLYTVPGQVYYNATRKLVLKGVDAVVFVADSARGKMDENVESLQNLRSNLQEHGLSLDRIPWIIQYNKRDLPDTYSVEELERVLNPRRVPSFEAVATSGQGVFDSFKAIARMLLKHLSAEIGVQVVPSTSAASEGGATAGAAHPGDRSRSPHGAPHPPVPEAAPFVSPLLVAQPEPRPKAPPERQPEPQPEPIAPPSASRTEPKTVPLWARGVEEGEAPGVDVGEASRLEAMGERLRRWLAGPRPEEESSQTEAGPWVKKPEIVPPTQPAAAASLDASRDSLSEAQLAVRRRWVAQQQQPDEVEFERPGEEQPERQPEPERQAELQSVPDGISDAGSEEATESAPSPEPLAPRQATEEPQVDGGRPFSLSLYPVAPSPTAEALRDGGAAVPFREVPILVDLDPEDLQVGVVLKLRIAVRQRGLYHREERRADEQDEAA